VNNDLTVLAVVKDGIDQTDLDGFYTEAYRQALIDFNTYPPFNSLVALINGYFIEIIIYSVSISFVIFYLILPLSLKRGQTLGKRLSGLIVVNDKGYAMQWWQLPLRSVVLGVTLFTALYTVFGSLLLSYTLMVFTKGYRSANDFLGLTKIVDGKTSKIFKTESEMLAYEHTLTSQESDQLLGK
ncbi:MAG: RDD family protein, partial [Bacilli bacterium]